MDFMPIFVVHVAVVDCSYCDYFNFHSGFKITWVCAFYQIQVKRAICRKTIKKSGALSPKLRAVLQPNLIHTSCVTQRTTPKDRISRYKTSHIAQKTSHIAQKTSHITQKTSHITLQNIAYRTTKHRISHNKT